ncbi:multicopper oxidase family protein [Methylocapsa palsarum]|uniref:multicopper oxidase family protein n=1 Tax=Methylocapsa palsarum TaxID=1612308 RepID=UPI001FCDAF1E|nr:multicopper oxidase family protein [Methylocapsa palsarum]
MTLINLPARAPAAPDGFRTMEAREGTLRLLPEPAGLTPIWGFDGASPGPLLRYKKGDEVKIRLVNRLSQPLTLSWQGVRIVNAMDGVGGLTQEPAPPGGSFDYRFTPPDSGLFWYHPHVLPLLGEQLERGLYGVLIVDEADPPAADKDMLVVLDDWTLDGEARIAGFGAEAAGPGRIGSCVTLNSAQTPATLTMPPASRLRLRILNAANARIMQISFDGVKPWILAVDGQPCEAFEPNRQTIPVGPGARFDVMMDLPDQPGARAVLTLRGDGEADRALLEIKTEGAKRPELSPIGSLPENPLLPRAIRLEASRKIDVTIEAVSPPAAAASGRLLYWKLNGTAWDGWARKPLFSVKRGAPVTLGLVNRTPFVQQIHVHGHHMRLLHDLDDGWEPYWRDSVLVPAGKTKHVAFVADNPGKWVIEGLTAERQCSGMATWFEVS